MVSVVYTTINSEQDARKIANILVEEQIVALHITYRFETVTYLFLESFDDIVSFLMPTYGIHKVAYLIIDGFTRKLFEGMS